jgi:hypothetical protein
MQRVPTAWRQPALYKTDRLHPRYVSAPLGSRGGVGGTDRSCADALRRSITTAPGSDNSAEQRSPAG